MKGSEPQSIPRYPLAWPDGWKRARERKRAQFKNAAGRANLSVYDGLGRVIAELGRLGVDDNDIVISTNVRTRLDGLPRSDQPEPSDPGAAVYWMQGEARRVMAIDVYDRVADNLAAIAATLEALRAIERHGGAVILERAYMGFDALPAPGQTSAPTWREVLQVGQRPNSLDTAERQYRVLRSQYHPDKPGGDREKFELVQRAIEQARQELMP